jgi:hypothetical protein
MFGTTILIAVGFATLLSSRVLALDCVPREATQIIQDPSFEGGGEFSEWDSRNAVVGNAPVYPAHSGSKSLLVE